MERTTPASVDDVWSVLADGWLFPCWVVGASRMRAVSRDWPAPGGVLHHSVGTWPVLLNDTTTVEQCRPKERLVLRARVRPLGEVEVVIELFPTPEGGCRMVISEDVVRGPGTVTPKPIRWIGLVPRNRETLRRLALLAERASDPEDGGSAVQQI